MARAKQQQSETDEAAVAKRPARLADLHDGRRVTPMLRQFLTMKEQVPDALLLFRMGDFYEMFFEDAEVAARVLDLTLTARDKSGANPIPMAGVPHHAVRGYIRRLIEAGYRVAVADQVEDPKLARGIVKRAVTEIVTPGLLLDPESLDAQASNYLVAFLVGRSGRVGLARIDISTGEFACTELDDLRSLSPELERLAPSEVLLPESLQGDSYLAELGDSMSCCWVPTPDHSYSLGGAREELCELFGVADLAGLGLAGLDLAVRAAGGVLAYLRSAHIETLAHVRRLRPYSLSAFMALDASTRRNLELFRTLVEGKRSGSLLGLLDKSTTSMGSRLLRRWLSEPLLEPAAIAERLDAVQILVDSPELREQLRERLDRVHDIERLVGRVCSGRVTARDLVSLRRSLEQAPAIDLLLDRDDTRSLPVFAPLPDVSELCSAIEETLADDPPAGLKEGGLIRRGFDSDLDELVDLSREGKGALARLESDERRSTGIGSLKVRYNRVFGYYIEVTKANIKLVPEHYIRKQTLANAERFYTPELKEFEAKVLGAEERRCSLEFELFCQLRERLAARARELVELAACIAVVDVLATFAEIAVRFDYVRPIVDEGTRLELEASRHPVIEQMKLGERFVPNDILLDRDENQLVIVTGPNMAGKSTVMRQVALIVLMAQAGSFVPAKKARIGIADRIFTRVGASDNIARGQSTFMVEMAETAAILSGATDRSLAILDEIGRGTSTYDGLAIAWAVAEHIADELRCRTLFATHYHELVELAGTREHVANFNIAVSQLGERVIFLRRLRPGGASRSYGIQVARLAGLPEPVLTRAREVLSNLERNAEDEVGRPRLARIQDKDEPPTGQLGLFSDRTRFLKDELVALELDKLTPLEALNVLAELKARAEQS